MILRGGGRLIVLELNMLTFTASLVSCSVFLKKKFEVWKVNKQTDDRHQVMAKAHTGLLPGELKWKRKGNTSLGIYLLWFICKRFFLHLIRWPGAIRGKPYDSVANCIPMLFQVPYWRYARCWWHLMLHIINVEKNVSRLLFHFFLPYLCLHTVGLVRLFILYLNLMSVAKINMTRFS
jgi:hypothetical protein